MIFDYIPLKYEPGQYYLDKCWRMSMTQCFFPSYISSGEKVGYHMPVNKKQRRIMNANETLLSKHDGPLRWVRLQEGLIPDDPIHVDCQIGVARLYSERYGADPVRGLTEWRRFAGLAVEAQQEGRPSLRGNEFTAYSVYSVKDFVDFLYENQSLIDRILKLST